MKDLNRASIDWMDISVSVVVFETDPADLSALLGSFAGSNLRLRITVVDNSQTSALSAIAHRFGVAYVKPARNLGFGGGHNVALRSMLGRTSYHLVINPDITLTAGALDRIFHFMEANPEVGQAMPRILYPDGSLQPLCKLLPTPADLFARRFLRRIAATHAGKHGMRYELHHVDLSHPTRVPCLSGCFMFLRDTTLQQCGLFDERYFLYMEDVDLCRRIGACSSTVFFPEVSVTHRYSKGSYRQRRLLRYHLESAWRYFNKWGWWRDPQRRALNDNISRLEPQHPKISSVEDAA